VYKTVTDGDELFTMQPNFAAKMVKDKTRQYRIYIASRVASESQAVNHAT